MKSSVLGHNTISSFSLLALLLYAPMRTVDAFIDEILQAAFGGGGGGGGRRMHFQMGGHPRQQIKWPRGYSEEIGKKFSFMKGTEWAWDFGHQGQHGVKFNKDGRFDAPTQDCQRGLCKWSANKGKVFILWGNAGVHEMTFDQQLPTEQDPTQMSGMRMRGTRISTGESVQADFSKVFDFEAAGLDIDLYEVLGLEDTADEFAIKKVYKKMAIKYHPDKVGNDKEAKATFGKIRDAYEVLNDPKKKILYDTGGMEAVKALEKGEVQTGENTEMVAQIDLEDLYNSADTKVSVNRRVVCRGCRNKPADPKCKGCRKCPDEVKMVNVQVGPGMIMQQQQQVSSKEFCKHEDSVIDVHIEKGMRDGDSITFPHMSEQRPGMIPGDVVIKLAVDKNKRFERRGDDLHMKTSITLREALLGFKKILKHMDGHTVEIETQGVTKPLQVIRIKDEGMPLRDDPQSFGNLYLKVEVVFPKKLNAEQKKMVDEMFSDVSARTEL